MSDEKPPSGDDEFPDRDPFGDHEATPSDDAEETITVVPDGSMRSDPDPAPVLEGDDGTSHPPGLQGAERSSGVGGRLAGFLALVLGVIGSALSVLAAGSSVLLGFGAGDDADRLVAPVEASIDRLDTRVDQADELIGPATDDQRAGVLAARVDGLVDLTTAASQAFATIDDHPVYGRLPVALADLGRSLDDFNASAMAIESELVADDAGSNSPLEADRVQSITDTVNSMQSGMADVRDEVETVRSSLTNWIRLGGLAGFVLSSWSLWGQSWLARRGWRGLRGIEP